MDLQSLSPKELARRAARLVRPYRITDGRGFRLSKIDPRDTGRFTSDDKDDAREALAFGVDGLASLQDCLYAQDRWSLLVIFQAMDAAGKDGAIKHVFSGVNPQGCQVASFKAPSAEELDHDYLWRCQRHLPERGRIGIFNRSYYEEVLVARVHPQILAGQKLAPKLITADIWDERLKDIRSFERYLSRNGTAILKFFLHVSKEEQRRRFIARIDDRDKNWKFSVNDAKERQHWKDYMHAYEEAIRGTATPEAPWYVVPADNKWFTRLVVAAAIADRLSSLGLEYPKVDAAKRRDLAATRRALMREKK